MKRLGGGIVVSDSIGKGIVEEGIVGDFYDNNSYGHIPHSFKADKKEFTTTNKIEVSVLAYRKLMHYIDAALPNEVSGLGRIKCIKREVNIYRVEDIYLLKQISSGGHTVLNKDDLAEFTFELVKRGEDTDNLRLWWHSHANMGCFWSTVDDSNCNDFNADTYMISIVGDSKHNLLGRLDLYSPKRMYDKSILPNIYFNDNDEKLRKECFKEVEKKNVQEVFKYEQIKGIERLWKTDRIIRPSKNKCADKSNRSRLSRFFHHPIINKNGC